MDYATNPQAVNLERLKARRRGKNDPLQPLPLGTTNIEYGASMDSCLSWLQNLPDSKETQKLQIGTSMDMSTAEFLMILDATKGTTGTLDFDGVLDLHTTDVVRFVGRCFHYVICLSFGWSYPFRNPPV